MITVRRHKFNKKSFSVGQDHAWKAYEGDTNVLAETPDVYPFDETKVSISIDS